MERKHYRILLLLSLSALALIIAVENPSTFPSSFADKQYNSTSTTMATPSTAVPEFPNPALLIVAVISLGITVLTRNRRASRVLD